MSIAIVAVETAFTKSGMAASRTMLFMCSASRKNKPKPTSSETTVRATDWWYRLQRFRSTRRRDQSYPEQSRTDDKRRHDRLGHSVTLFADIVALFQYFAYPSVLEKLIRSTRGDLDSKNLPDQLAQQFGTHTPFVSPANVRHSPKWQERTRRSICKPNERVVVQRDQGLVKVRTR